MTRNKKNQMPERIIKMDTKTINELRSFARDKGLRGYYKLKKADLIVLLLEQSTEEMPTPTLRSKGKKRRPVITVKIIPSPQEMDEFQKEEMKKKTPVGKNKLNQWYDWLVDYVPKLIKNVVGIAFSRAKNSMLRLHDGAKKTLKGDLEGEAEKENQEEDINLTPHEHERALKGAYRSFVIPGAPKTDIDSYFDQTKPHIKTFIKNQLGKWGLQR